MNSTKRKVCIIILSWNGYEYSRACLLSLQKINYPNYQIVLVDNASDDNSAELLSQEFPFVDILQLDENKGFTGGNNKGIQFAQEKYAPEFFLLLNNDTEVEPDFLNHLVLPFSNDNNIYATVPKIYYFEKKDIIWFAGGHVRRLTGNVKEYNKGKKDTNQTFVQAKTKFMTGCAALIHKNAISEVGYLDERFYAYSEDADYSLRILKSGHSIVFVPESVVYHKVSRSFRSAKGLSYKYYLATRNIVFLQRKHLVRSAFLLFTIWFPIRWVLYLTVKLILTGSFKQISSLYRGYRDGIIKSENGK